MTEILIQSMIPSSGSGPSEGYDPVSHAPYTEWELGEKALFSVKAPEDYSAGSDFRITMEESSSSVSMNHKWNVDTLLLRPGLHATDEQVETESFGQEFTCPDIADRLSDRSFEVTGQAEAGRVSDVALQAGDVLAFSLSRVAASENEDPYPIKVFGITISVNDETIAISSCAGRVGNIIDTVRDLFNESAGGFLSDDFIIRSLNRCLQDIAQEDYWRRETWLPSVSGQAHADLLTNLPDYQDLHQVLFSGQIEPMTHLGSFLQYEELKTGDPTTGQPIYYVVQNNDLYVWPEPNVSLTSGYCIYHSYLPANLTCSSSNPNPPLPRAHDMVFVYYALKQAFLRDRHAPGADVKYREYSELYLAAKKNLLGEGDPPRLSLQSYRQ